MRPITIDDLKAVAEENPTKVNPACRYFNYDESPCCIIGNAFARAGITVDDIDRDKNSMIVSYLPSNLFANEKVKKFARILQYEADDSIPWGDALNFFYDVSKKWLD